MTPYGFVIGNGEAYVLPTQQGPWTITCSFPRQEGDPPEGRYIKLRDIILYLGENPPSPEDWACFGQGSQQLFVQKKSVLSAMSYHICGSLPQSPLQERIWELVNGFFTLQEKPFARAKESAASDLSVRPILVNLAEWMTRPNVKITTVMCQNRHLIVAALSRLYKGDTKVHNLVAPLFSLWDDDRPLMNRKYVITKVGIHKTAGESELRNNLTVSQLLSPEVHSIRFTAVTRGIACCETHSKMGLISEYYNGNNLFKYLERHYSNGSFWAPVFGKPMEEFLPLAKQIAETLAELHSRDFVHGDVRLENIFIQLLDGKPRAYLADFDLTCQRGTPKSRQLFGTYPPPLSSAELGRASPQEETVPVDFSIDCWAFGIVLFILYHKGGCFLKGLSFNKGSETIGETSRQMRYFLLTSSCHPTNDRVDELICRLLDPEPERRGSMADALTVLSEAVHPPCSNS